MDIIKTCKKCLFTGDYSFFVKEKSMSDGFRNECRKCKAVRDKESVERRKDARKIKSKEWYYSNREKILADKKVYHKENREKAREYRSNRIKTDELYRFKECVRGAIKSSFRRSNNKKDTNTAKIIGCDFAVFKLYIESKFESWMNWENYGKYNSELNHGWDLDHIIPIETAKTKEDIITLNHYTNFQPLCSYINRTIKRNKL